MVRMKKLRATPLAPHGARNACAMAAAYALSKPVLEKGEMLSRVVPRKKAGVRLDGMNALAPLA